MLITPVIYIQSIADLTLEGNNFQVCEARLPRQIVSCWLLGVGREKGR